jgi:MscS family membrane protein
MGPRVYPWESIIKKKVMPPGPLDDYNRGTPRTMMIGYINAARNGKFEIAANYLDLRKIPASQRQQRGPQLARQLKVNLDRTLVSDPELLSSDPKGQTLSGR